MEDLLCPHKCVEYSLDTHVKKKKMVNFVEGLNGSLRKLFVLWDKTQTWAKRAHYHYLTKYFTIYTVYKIFSNIPWF